MPAKLQTDGLNQKKEEILICICFKADSIDEERVSKWHSKKALESGASLSYLGCKRPANH